MDSSKIRSILETLGYNLTDKGLYWQCAALYRNGDNPTALQIYKNTGAWKDYVENTAFSSFRNLLALTLRTNDPKELSKYLNKDEIFFLSEKINIKEEKIQMEKVYPSSLLSKLLPHYKFYNDRGISSNTLENLNAGLATKGAMYQRFVFPIYNSHSQIIGFSGRDMSGKDGKPKWKHKGRKTNWVYPAYVPSSDGLLFDYSKKDYVIIVESIGDCLSLIEKGFNNVLVSFGLDISSKLLCAIVGFNFKNIYISFNNDLGKSDNRGMEAAVKNYLKLLNYYDKENIKICLPDKNDFGDMDDLDFKKWKQKLLLIKDIDQTPKVFSFAKNLEINKKLSKALIKNIELLK